MTSLENFLNKNISDDSKSSQLEPASGSFSCQHESCKEVVYEGAIDKINNKLIWTCTQGHKSSVAI
jgi:hypothetical protein